MSPSRVIAEVVTVCPAWSVRHDSARRLYVATWLTLRDQHGEPFVCVEAPAPDLLIGRIRWVEENVVRGPGVTDQTRDVQP